MTTFKTVNNDYTLTCDNGNGVFTVNAQTVFNGNVVYTVPATSVSPFITVAANNTGAITDGGLLMQTGPSTFAGFRFDTGVNAWQISANVYANGSPATAYANIGGLAFGANTQVQYNNNGELDGSPNFTFDYANSKLSINGNITATGNITANNFVGNIATSARILYVATNGNDSNSGIITAPFLTIKAAMAAATAGTSVHVAPGTYNEVCPITIPANVALMGDNLRSVVVQPTVASADMFYVTNGCYVWGITIKGYTGNGFSFNPATPTQNVFVSPYIQNLTSSTTTGTAVLIDGNNVSSISTKAMIVGFFTIINQGGKGIYIKNSGYSQLVNIYTIACDVGVKVESGAFCTLNGSDCSIGNYGLVADGIGPLQTSAVTSGYSTNGVFILNNETNGQPHVNTVMQIDGDPEYYTIDTIIPTSPTTSTVVIQQTYTGNLAPGTTVSFYTRSSIIASAHTFEYVGAGTNPATALPQNGGIPIEANEVIATNGGVVTFTSTDQKGNFKVGKGFIINQATGTITGNDFYKSLYAQMTPYILALSPAP